MGGGPPFKGPAGGIWVRGRVGHGFGHSPQHAAAVGWCRLSTQGSGKCRLRAGDDGQLRLLKIPGRYASRAPVAPSYIHKRKASHPPLHRGPVPALKQSDRQTHFTPSPCSALWCSSPWLWPARCVPACAPSCHRPPRPWWCEDDLVDQQGSWHGSYASLSMFNQLTSRSWTLIGISRVRPGHMLPAHSSPPPAARTMRPNLPPATAMRPRPRPLSTTCP